MSWLLQFTNSPVPVACRNEKEQELRGAELRRMPCSTPLDGSDCRKDKVGLREGDGVPARVDGQVSFFVLGRISSRKVIRPSLLSLYIAP